MRLESNVETSDSWKVWHYPVLFNITIKGFLTTLLNRYY
jgi:hypothetical protein